MKKRSPRGSKRARDKVITKIWSDLEELESQMTSGLAEDLTLSELMAVDAAVEKILTTTTGWFNRLAGGYIAGKRPHS